MKKLWLLSILAIVVVSAVYCLWMFRSGRILEEAEGARIEKPESLAYLPMTELRKSGSALISRLESPMVIDGYPCDANWIQFTEIGRLRAFFLSDACLIQGNRIPKGTWVQLYPDLSIRFCSFPEDTIIQGYLCDGGSGGAKGVTASFYPSGRLKGFYPPRDVEIKGIPCRASPINGISVYENGNLEGFTLSRNTIIGGRALSSGQRVVLNEQGDIKSVTNPPIYERPLGWITRFFPGSG